MEIGKSREVFEKIYDEHFGAVFENRKTLDLSDIKSFPTPEQAHSARKKISDEWFEREMEISEATKAKRAAETARVAELKRQQLKIKAQFNSSPAR